MTTAEAVGDECMTRIARRHRARQGLFPEARDRDREAARPSPIPFICKEAAMKVRLILSIAFALLYFSPHGVAQAADVVRVSDGPFLSGGGYYVAREKGS